MKQENLIYLAVWGLLFAAPILSLYIRMISDANTAFSWGEVFVVWRHFAVYLLLFLIHNFLLAPLLIHRHKRVAYFTTVAMILAVFTVYQCSNRQEKKFHRPPMDHIDHAQPSFDRPPMTVDGERPPMPDEAPPPPDDAPPMPDDAPPLPDKRPPHRMHKAVSPPPIVGEHDVLAVVVLLLMFGANLGLKGYFRGRYDRKRLAELEKQNLEQQLEYLRYQINPHFFMNTLNNIHALVDIDPEQAKGTILELSKMMRFVLYEGNKQGVPLSREFDFIRHYVSLMQLRYTDKVKISLNLPQESPDRQIPPLILITFIENAFKHGISYQRESFIEVTAVVESEALRFNCRNSKAVSRLDGQGMTDEGDAVGEKGGVGLANVRKRLNLIYDHDYTLKIRNNPDVFHVELVIPLLS